MNMSQTSLIVYLIVVIFCLKTSIRNTIAFNLFCIDFELLIIIFFQILFEQLIGIYLFLDRYRLI